MSKIEPNTTQTPNLYLDRLMYLLDEGELKTLLYAVRRTMGFHKGSDRISLSQFMNGNRHTDENGVLVEHGTGLSKTTQIKALKQLVSYGILIEVNPNSANMGVEWALQLDERKIDWGALRERHEARGQHGRKQTKAARVAAKAQQKQGGLFNKPPARQSIQQTTGGLFNRPPAVYPTDHQVVYSTDPQKKERKPGRKKEEKDNDESLEIVWASLLTLCDGDQDTAVRLWQLQAHLSAVSHLPLPDIDTDAGRAELQTAWWPVLLEIDEKAGGKLETAKTGMDTAVAEIDAWKPEALQAPKSILKKTIAYFAAAQRGAANGHMAQPAYAQYKI